MPIAAILASMAASNIAHAQVTVTNLHPAGSLSSGANATANGLQGGISTGHAGIWSGTAASWVDLHPTVAINTAISSTINGMSNGQQVGSVTLTDAFGEQTAFHAALWSGTAASYVDLSPVSSIHPDNTSAALAVHNGQQVGYTRFGSTENAALWSGTAASLVNLQPTGTGILTSQALGVFNGQQVGYVHRGGNAGSAALWSGTANSLVELNPAGAVSSSAYGIHNGQQAGSVSVNVGVQVREHASIWTGTAASWVDIHPAAATESRALAVHDGKQVGFATIGTVTHASLWTGTADSWVDLSTYLTGSWGDTQAKSIWSDDSSIYISGTGFNLSTNRQEALLWVVPVPEPGSILLASLGGVLAVARWRRFQSAK